MNTIPNAKTFINFNDNIVATLLDITPHGKDFPDIFYAYVNVCLSLTYYERHYIERYLPAIQAYMEGLGIDDEEDLTDEDQETVDAFHADGNRYVAELIAGDHEITEEQAEVIFRLARENAYAVLKLDRALKKATKRPSAVKRPFAVKRPSGFNLPSDLI